MTSKNLRAQGGHLKKPNQEKMEEAVLSGREFAFLVGSGELRKIENDFKARIEVSGNRGDINLERRISIHGSKDVRAAVKSRLEAVFRPTLHLPSKEVQYLLGHALAVIQEEFKVLVLVQGTKGDSSRPVIISCAPEDKAKIVQAIKSAVEKKFSKERKNVKAPLVRDVGVRLAWDKDQVMMTRSFKEASKGTKLQLKQGMEYMVVRLDQALTGVEEEARMMFQCTKSSNDLHLHLQDGQGRKRAFIGRAATGVGIRTIGQYTDHLSWSVFLEAKVGALLYVQISVKHFVKKWGKIKFSGGSPVHRRLHPGGAAVYRGGGDGGVHRPPPPVRQQS